MQTIKTINPDLASLHGYLCADGYVISHKNGSKRKFYIMALRNTEKILLGDFKEKFRKVFGLTPHISKEFDRVYIADKNICQLLTLSFGSFYSNEWAFPKIFKSKKIKSAWLRSVFDCEGWVCVTVGIDRRIGIEMINLKGMKSIQKLLKEFGIKSKFKEKKGGKIFRVEIFGKENIAKFSKTIGFLHPKKSRLLQKAIESYFDPMWSFPKKELLLKKFILKKLNGKSGKINRRRIKLCSSLRVNLVRLKHYLNKFFKIKSIVSKKHFNGEGNHYFELSINSMPDIAKIVKIQAINGIQ